MLLEFNIPLSAFLASKALYSDKYLSIGSQLTQFFVLQRGISQFIFQSTLLDEVILDLEYKLNEC
jgi:hypothetical protein